MVLAALVFSSPAKLVTGLLHLENTSKRARRRHSKARRLVSTTPILGSCCGPRSRNSRHSSLLHRFLANTEWGQVAVLILSLCLSTVFIGSLRHRMYIRRGALAKNMEALNW